MLRNYYNEYLFLVGMFLAKFLKFITKYPHYYISYIVSNETINSKFEHKYVLFIVTLYFYI